MKWFLPHSQDHRAQEHRLQGLCRGLSEALGAGVRGESALEEGLPGDTGVEKPAATRETRLPSLGREIPGGDSGNPLQYSCLENPVDRAEAYSEDCPLSRQDSTSAPSPPSRLAPHQKPPVHLLRASGCPVLRRFPRPESGDRRPTSSNSWESSVSSLKRRVETSVKVKQRCISCQTPARQSEDFPGASSAAGCHDVTGDLQRITLQLLNIAKSSIAVALSAHSDLMYLPWLMTVAWPAHPEDPYSAVTCIWVKPVVSELLRLFVPANIYIFFVQGKPGKDGEKGEKGSPVSISPWFLKNKLLLLLAYNCCCFLSHFRGFRAIRGIQDSQAERV